MFKKRKYSEQELVEGCKKNNRTHQEQLYRLYFASMMQMCGPYANDREEAKTIVNDGFLRVFKKIELFTFKGSLEGWIRKLVWHSLSDHFRKRANYLHFLVLEDRDAPLPENTLNELYVEDILKLVDRLPPATQKVFRLYAIEGYTHVEIAKKIDISEGTSKWHLSAARKKLKKMMQQHNSIKNHAG